MLAAHRRGRPLQVVPLAPAARALSPDRPIGSHHALLVTVLYGIVTLCCCVPLHTMEASQPGRPLVRVDSGQQRCVRHLHSRRHSAASAACDACTGTAGNRHVGIGARVTANTDGACNAGDAAALGLPCAPTTHPVSVATHAQHPLSRSARTRFTAPLARSMPSILNAYRSSAMDMALSPACTPYARIGPR